MYYIVRKGEGYPAAIATEREMRNANEIYINLKGGIYEFYIKGSAQMVASNINAGISLGQWKSQRKG